MRKRSRLVISRQELRGQKNKYAFYSLNIATKLEGLWFIITINISPDGTFQEVKHILKIKVRRIFHDTRKVCDVRLITQC